MAPKDTRMAPPPTDPLAVELARFEAERVRSEQAIAEAKAKEAHHLAQNREGRREFVGGILIGVAIVAIILAVIGAMWHGAVSGNWSRERIEAERTEQVRACIASLEDPTERQLCVALMGTQEDRES